MADKYCDHGAYGAGVVTGYICSVNGAYNGTAGTFLTVTGVTSGVIGVGSHITGLGIPANSLVQSFVTGTQGGVGCYTVTWGAAVPSTTIDSKYAAPLNTPRTWGLPQEGDGTTTTAATASATVSIGLSAATAAAGATVSIMGATLTCVASGATVNNFNAGTGATLVANLVAAINRTTATRVVAAQATGWPTPKIQDAVFARVGTPSTTLEIMTRAGSAVYNSSQVTTAGLTGGTFGPYTFSGGSGGCWGHVVNATDCLYWPSAQPKFTYGIWGSTSPSAGTIEPGDAVNIRSNKLIPGRTNANSSMLPFLATLGTYDNPVIFKIDDSTIWADGSEPVFELRVFDAFQFGVLTNGTGSAHFSEINGKQYASGIRNLKFSADLPTNFALVVQAGMGVLMRNAEFVSLRGASKTEIQVGFYATPPNPASLTRFENCRFVTRSGTSAIIAATTSTLPLELRSCVLEVDTSIINTPHTGVFSMAGGTVETDVVLEGCTFVGFTPASRLFSVASIGQWGAKQTTFNFRDCDFGSVSIRGPVFGQTVTNRGLVSEYTHSAVSTSVIGSCDWFNDNMLGYTAWTQLRYPPTCYAKQEDGTTGWAIEVVPATVANMIAWNAPLKAPRIYKKNTLSDGARDFTLQIAVDATLAFTKRDVGLTVQYVAVDGTLVTVDSFDVNGAALAAGTGTWSNESGGQVVFAANGTAHDKKQLSVSTLVGKPLKTGTRISATVCFYTSVTNVSQVTLVDPEVVIS